MNTQETVREISVSDLSEWIRSGREFQLIDVREPFESEIATLGGILIPKGEILLHQDRISKNTDVVVYCRSGKRSRDVIALLQRESGFKNLYNLKGGILAWADEIDPSLTKY